MKVLVCGSTGCVGSAIVQALQARGHRVLAGSRRGGDVRVDFMTPVPPHAWAALLRRERVDAVVNAIGILREHGGQTYARVHADGPAELFRGAALAGLRSVVQVSALGAAAGTSPYLASKRKADYALLTALPRTAAVLRPSLVFGPDCASTRLFGLLARVPLVVLPGGGHQRLAPLHVYELAEIAARCVDRPAAGVHEVGGADVHSYRTMLATYRAAAAAGPALWLPLPMAVLRAVAWIAEALPQQLVSRRALDLLAAGSVPADNAARRLLGRAPSGLAEGLAVTPATPLRAAGPATAR